MKYLILLLMHTFLSTGACAQNIKNDKVVSLSYNETVIGKNVNLTFRHEIASKFSVYGGIKYHINANWYKSDIVPLRNSTPDEHVYFARVDATKLREHFGVKLGLEKAFYIKNSNTEWFIFYDFQYTKPNFDIMGGGIDSMGNTFLYTPWPTGLGNVGNILESYIGCGARVYAGKRVNMIMQAGIGAYKFTGGKFFYSSDVFATKWDMAYLLGMGLEYKLGVTEQKATNTKNKKR